MLSRFLGGISTRFEIYSGIILLQSVLGYSEAKKMLCRLKEDSLKQVKYICIISRYPCCTSIKSTMLLTSSCRMTKGKKKKSLN